MTSSLPWWMYVLGVLGVIGGLCLMGLIYDGRGRW